VNNDDQLVDQYIINNLVFSSVFIIILINTVIAAIDQLVDQYSLLFGDRKEINLFYDLYMRISYFRENRLKDVESSYHIINYGSSISALSYPLLKII